MSSVVDSDREERESARRDYERFGPLPVQPGRIPHPWLWCLCDRCKRFREARMLPGQCVYCHVELYGETVDTSYLRDAWEDQLFCAGTGRLHRGPKVTWAHGARPPADAGCGRALG